MVKKRLTFDMVVVVLVMGRFVLAVTFKVYFLLIIIEFELSRVLSGVLSVGALVNVV